MWVKCKMCGGDMQISHVENLTVYTCEYCGSQLTLPNLDDEQKIFRYNRANQYRLQNDYDGARQQFDMLLNYSKEDSEIYWSILLCEYGIEYVKDPLTGKRIPTCHRTVASPISSNPNYLSALKFASDQAKILYQREAEVIDHLQKDILSVSQTVEPYDIFICYKESDDNGARTIDSVAAQEIYDRLEDNGYRVFFSRQTLRSVPGTAYEPYIYAALKSSRVMIVIGSQRKYFESPWVKNEWNRFLAQIQAGEKKLLIPAYKGMSPYDLPDELGPFQAQNLNDLGYYQDLIAGISRFLGKEKKQSISDNIYGYLEVGFQHLGMGDRNKAMTFFETANALEPKCCFPYLGLIVADEPQKKKYYCEKFLSLSTSEDREKMKEYLMKCKKNVPEYLMTFLSFGDDKCAWACLDIADVDFNVIIDGYTPLCYAIKAKNDEIAQAICHISSINLDMPCCEDTLTPLAAACESSNLKILEMLLEEGASPNISYQIPNTKMRTLPIGTCIEHDFVDGVQKLLEHGAGVGREYDPCGVPLAHAIQKGRKKICDILLQNGANINQMSRGIPVFVNMIYAEDSSMIQYCHHHGADFEKEIPYGNGMIDLIYFTLYSERTKYLREIIENGGKHLYLYDLKRLRGSIRRKKIIFVVLMIVVFCIIFWLLHAFFYDLVHAFEDRETGEQDPVGFWVVLTISSIIWAFPYNFFKSFLFTTDDLYQKDVHYYQLLRPYLGVVTYGEDN